MTCNDCIQEGTFLVREKKDDVNFVYYAISVVVSNNEIKHVPVRLRQDGRYAIGMPKFNEKVRRLLLLLVCFVAPSGANTTDHLFPSRCHFRLHFPILYFLLAHFPLLYF